MKRRYTVDRARRAEGTGERAPHSGRRNPNEALSSEDVRDAGT